MVLLLGDEKRSQLPQFGGWTCKQPHSIATCPHAHALTSVFGALLAHLLLSRSISTSPEFNSPVLWTFPPQLIGTWTYLFSDARPFTVSESTTRLQEGEEEARRN